MELKEFMRYVIRAILIFFANLIGIPAFIVFCLLLYPLKRIHPEFYWKFVEPHLFKALLGMVTSWLYSGGYKVIESGDDVNIILDDEALVLVNHQSTSDVPFLISSLYPKGLASGYVNWVMDYIFKFSNFGWVSYFHEDFFISQGKHGRDEQLNLLKKHMYKSYLPTNKKWIVVFPEGGFLYKRRISSQRYAKKHNFPVLEHVTLPRIGAVKVIVDSMYHDPQRNGVIKDHIVPEERRLKWVIDITIGYPNQDSLSFPGMMAGIYAPCKVHLHYRVYPITQIPSDHDELHTWLYDRYTEKEVMLQQFYKTHMSMDKSDKEERDFPKMKEKEIQINMWNFVFLYIFYFVSSVIFWNCFYKHLINLFCWCFSFII